MSATAEQIQRYADERMRRRCESIRNLLASMQDDKTAIDAIYAELAGGGQWTDARADGPPALLTGSDVLAYNTAITELIAAIQANSQLAVVLKACVRPVLEG